MTTKNLGAAADFLALQGVTNHSSTIIILASLLQSQKSALLSIAHILENDQDNAELSLKDAAMALNEASTKANELIENINSQIEGFHDMTGGR